MSGKRGWRCGGRCLGFSAAPDLVCFEVFLLGLLFVPHASWFPAFLSPAVLPPASPPPLHPRRGEGELEDPIWFLCFGEVFLNRGAVGRVCWPRLGNDAVVVDGLLIGVAAVVGAAVFLLVVAEATAATTARAARQQASAR